MASLIPRRTAATALILCLLLPDGAIAAPTCPTAGSAAAVSCWNGAVFSSMPPSTAAACTCDCNFGTSIIYVASAAACTAAYCTTIVPGTCASVQNVQAATATTLVSYMTANGQTGPLVQKSHPANSICYTYSATCTADPTTNPCGVVPNGTAVLYGAFEDNLPSSTAVADCAATQSGGLANFIALCVNSQCNAQSASAHLKPAAALLAAAVAAACWL
jgi:hypothetical protein